ncbi:hypothetical protein SAMN06309944_0170 [Micrococcales bacterium KH10]|nr:hypothetical protein SAMN06309944_0170 [Micrococcales bacterium KH10]
MAASKTFANNAVLTANDLNTYVNPSTAAHVPYAFAAGEFDMPSIAAGAVSSGTIGLPSGRFTQPPIVVVTVGNYRIIAAIGTITTTTASYVLYNPSSAAGGSAKCRWTAIQMTPTNAAG